MLNANEWRKIYHANSNQNKVGVVILILDRADFRARKVIRDKKGYYIMMKWSVLQEYVTSLNEFICV